MARLSSLGAGVPGEKVQRRSAGMTLAVRQKRKAAEDSEGPDSGVKVVGLGTDHRLSLVQNPAVRGNVARPLPAVEMR